MQAEEPDGEASAKEPMSEVRAKRLDDLRRRLLAASTMGDPGTWHDLPSDSPPRLLDNIVQFAPRLLRTSLATP